MKIFTRQADEISLLVKIINAKGEFLSILEAGCGRQWPLHIISKYKLTGIDLDPDALKTRVTTIGDLDEAIVGDLLIHDFPSESFDLIYNAYVLEHINGAEKVLANFTRWLKPGGLLLLQIPPRQNSCH